MSKSHPDRIGTLDARHRDHGVRTHEKRSDTPVRSPAGSFHDSETLVDANLQRYAHDAGKRAHDVGLDKRGSVTKQSGQFLVRESRDGTVDRLKPLPATTKVQSGTILSKKR